MTLSTIAKVAGTVIGLLTVAMLLENLLDLQSGALRFIAGYFAYAILDKAGWV